MMATENNQCFDFKKNESDELNRQKFFNSSLIKELRKYREENIKLKHEKELLNSIIKKLVEENKTLRSNLSSIKNKNPHEETMEIVENILLNSNHEIKDEPLDFYNLIQKFSNNCESCDKTFSDEEDLKLHRKAKHDHKKTEYGITSKKSRQQNQPIDKTNNGGENANDTNDHQNYYGPDQQHQIYAQDQHQQQQPPPAQKAKLDNENNQNLDKSHQCDQCPKNFAHKFLLARHIRSVHEGVKFSCEQCDQKFTEKWSLKSHILGVHEKLKRFKCNQCDKAYPQASGLHQHKKKIHPE